MLLVKHKGPVIVDDFLSLAPAKTNPVLGNSVVLKAEVPMAVVEPPLPLLQWLFPEVG